MYVNMRTVDMIARHPSDVVGVCGTVNNAVLSFFFCHTMLPLPCCALLLECFIKQCYDVSTCCALRLGGFHETVLREGCLVFEAQRVDFDASLRGLFLLINVDTTYRREKMCTRRASILLGSRANNTCPSRLTPTTYCGHMLSWTLTLPFVSVAGSNSHISLST